MAVSGSYMSRGDKIAEIKLWPVVRPRVRMRAPRFQSAMNGTEAAREIRTALCAISPFLVVHVVTDITQLRQAEQAAAASQKRIDQLDESHRPGAICLAGTVQRLLRDRQDSLFKQRGLPLGVSHRIEVGYKARGPVTLRLPHHGLG